MVKDWAPDGYEIKEVPEENWYRIVVIGFITLAPLAYLFVNDIGLITAPTVDFTLQLLYTMGISSPLGLFGFGVPLALAFVVVIYLGVMIGVHELLHYGVYRFHGVPARFILYKTKFLPNPAVAPEGVNTNTRPHLLSAYTPVVLIGLGSLILWAGVDGPIRGLAALYIMANTAVSCKDLNNAIWLHSLPRDARLASWFDEGEFVAEYAVRVKDE